MWLCTSPGAVAAIACAFAAPRTACWSHPDGRHAAGALMTAAQGPCCKHPYRSVIPSEGASSLRDKTRVEGPCVSRRGATLNATENALELAFGVCRRGVFRLLRSR